MRNPISTNLNKKINKNKLLYRRQFILGPRYIKHLRGWIKKRVSNDLFITIHPDLELTYASKGDTSLILLGFILDPYNPKYSNKDILNKIIRKNSSFERVIKCTYNLGGRYILIYKDKSSIKMLNDPAGDRQIYYFISKSNIWCASQPHTIAKELVLKKSDDYELINFLNSSKFRDTENSWIGDGTFYEGVKHLLPNHFLDLTKREISRYWPNRKLKKVSLNKAVTKTSKILKGLLKSITYRYSCVLAVTAGIDSRTLLAASRDVSKNIFYYIQKFGDLNIKSPDITVPSKLLPRLNLKFNVINCDKNIDPNFNSILDKNNYLIQSDKKKELYYNFYNNFEGMINIGGNVSEIARNYYEIKYPINAERLAEAFGRRGDAFTIKNIKLWMDETKKYLDKFNLEILDLFYWEQRIGNWCAVFGSNADIAIEQFYPFNCREILETLLAVEKKYRIGPKYILYRRLIANLWKDALKEPINPKSFIKKILSLGTIMFKRVEINLPLNKLERNLIDTLNDGSKRIVI